MSGKDDFSKSLRQNQLKTEVRGEGRGANQCRNPRESLCPNAPKVP